MDKQRKLVDLHEYYSTNPVPKNLSEIIRIETGVDLTSDYLGRLKNPILVAPGQMTVELSQIELIKNAGFAGCVLKSVVGEAQDGSCSMISQRKKPSYIRTFYEPDDVKEKRPIIHWDGRCDPRTLEEYEKFAFNAEVKFMDGNFRTYASILCHLPRPGEDFKEDEWIHTTEVLFDAAQNCLEIDFCPFLSSDNVTDDRENVLRWYRTCPWMMKSTDFVKVAPKLLNLDFGLDYQVAMAEASREGGADGVVVANRIYKPEYESGHGGEELRQRNLEQVRAIKNRNWDFPVSATGGIYNGYHVYEYLKAGADCVQLLSFIMGKVSIPFAKTDGNKFDQVFHKIMLDPNDGLIASILKYGEIK
jgi:hypothetical protein